jgi:hypothetical protein
MFTSTGAASVVNGGRRLLESVVTSTAAASSAVVTNTIQRRGVLAPVAQASTTSYTGGNAGVTGFAAATVQIAAAFNRVAALTGVAAASGVITGQFTAFKAFTSTAAGSVTVSPVVTPTMTITARGLMSTAGLKGAAVPLTATAAAATTIHPTANIIRSVLASSAAASVVNGGRQVVSRGFTATARATMSFAGGVLHRLKKTLTLDFSISGTIAPLPERFSTVQVRADMSGEPRSITGMQANALVGVSGDQSVITLGPPARFSVNVTATGRMSFITELQETATVEIGSQTRLRNVQSLTTILENGLPALLPAPPLSKLSGPEPEPQPAPEPEPVLTTPSVPVYDRVFMNVRR